MAKRQRQPANQHVGRNKEPLHVAVRIPKDLPITQIEIEVFAALLDDLDTENPALAEAAE